MAVAISRLEQVVICSGGWNVELSQVGPAP